MNVQIKYALCDWMAETSLQRSRVCVVSHIDYTEYCDSKKSDIDKFIEREDKKTMFTGDAKEVYEFLISQNAVHKRWKTCVKSFVRMKLTSGWSRKKISAAFNELVNVMKEYCKE
jgi:hypothetical protein